MHAAKHVAGARHVAHHQRDRLFLAVVIQDLTENAVFCLELALANTDDHFSVVTQKACRGNILTRTEGLRDNKCASFKLNGRDTVAASLHFKKKGEITKCLPKLS